VIWPGVDGAGPTPYAPSVASGATPWRPGGVPPEGEAEASGQPDVPDPSGTFEVTLKLPLPGQRDRTSGLASVLRVAAGRDLLAFAVVPPAGSVVVGRDEAADLVLGDASVSRRHARVECSAEGEFVVVDLDSTNGTMVNGRPVQRAPCAPGDDIEVGAVSLRLDVVQREELEHLRRVAARLAEAAGCDPLTGLLARSWLEEELPRLAEQARAQGYPLACVFLDLDHFKSVNDRFGHAVGDDVLRTTARLALLDCRETDQCVRYGGEEFVVFLRATPLVGGVQMAERLRRTIQGHDWSRIAPDLRVTCSAGIAVLRPEEDVGAWVSRADAAMYRAKSLGRNQVVAAEGD